MMPRLSFKNAVLALIWGWMLLFVFAPNVLVIIASLLTRDDVAFIRWQFTAENYARLLYTEGAVMAGLVYVLLPFMILPLYAIFEQLRMDLLEASSDLGAGRWRTFRTVVLPLTTPGIIAGSLLVLIPAVGMFYVADVLGGAKHLLVGNIIESQFLEARDWPFGAAASVLLTLAMAVLLYAYYMSARFVRGRSAHGALG